MLWDLRPLGLTGSKVEKVFEEIHITLNKNAVHGDVSAMAYATGPISGNCHLPGDLSKKTSCNPGGPCSNRPGGVRIGAPAMTSRGLKEADFEQIGDFLHRGLQVQVAGVSTRPSPTSYRAPQPHKSSLAL